jgi:hypothetical protein
MNINESIKLEFVAASASVELSNRRFKSVVECAMSAFKLDTRAQRKNFRTMCLGWVTEYNDGCGENDILVNIKTISSKLSRLMAEAGYPIDSGRGGNKATDERKAQIEKVLAFMASELGVSDKSEQSALAMAVYRAAKK